MNTTIKWVFIYALSLAGCYSDRYDAALTSGDDVTFVRAIKGNDIVVAKDGKHARIRLVGVYTFDPSVREKTDIQVWSTNAVEFAEHHLARQSLRVVLEKEGLDPKGRHLGYLHVGNVDLGAQMIEQGHAAVYTEYPFAHEKEYFLAERVARHGHRGLWGGDVAVKRILALRHAWASALRRQHGWVAHDPLFLEAEDKL